MDGQMDGGTDMQTDSLLDTNEYANSIQIQM